MSLVQLLYSIPTPIQAALLIGFSIPLGTVEVRLVHSLVPLLTLPIIFAFNRPLVGGIRVSPKALRAQIEEAIRFVGQ